MTNHTLRLARAANWRERHAQQKYRCLFSARAWRRRPKKTTPSCPALTLTCSARKSRCSKCWTTLASRRQAEPASSFTARARCIARRPPAAARFRSTWPPGATTATSAAAMEINSNSGPPSAGSPCTRPRWTCARPSVERSPGSNAGSLQQEQKRRGTGTSNHQTTSKCRRT